MSIKILLADDSITIQKVVGIIFGGDDYSLTVVDNGKTAIDKAKELLPDVLLIDALMPGMTGYEVCEAVRATPALATKPILLLTGSFEPFDENKAKSCGADDFIAKPFESQQIVTKVKEMFELGKARANAAAPQASPVIAPPPIVQNIQTPPVTPAIDAFTASPFESNTFETTAFETTAFETPTFATQQQEPVKEISTPPIQTFEPTEPTATPPGIWDAFTPIEESTPPEQFATKPDEPSPFAQQLPSDDVFSMVQEESEPVIAQKIETTPEQNNHTGSQWIPVEEQTYNFVEQKVAEIPTDVFSSPPQNAFGDISFASTPEQSESAITPTFTESAPAAFANFEPPAIPAIQETAFTAASMATATVATTAAMMTTEEVVPAESTIAVPPQLSAIATTATPLSEEQIKTLLSSVSKEVIERIVWEVVPDLAEVLIKEAIRKIRDGI